MSKPREWWIIYDNGKLREVRLERLGSTYNHIQDVCVVEKAAYSKAIEALKFYATNAGLFIDYKTNVFKSADSDGRDFHGAIAREVLKELGVET